MSPVERRISPYVVDSPDWEQPGALTDDGRDDLGQDKITSVMSVFTKVYSVSKVVQVAFVNFGVEVRGPNTNSLSRTVKVLTSSFIA